VVGDNEGMTDATYPTIDSGTPVDHRDLHRFGGRHAIVVNEAQEQFASWIGEAPDYELDLGTGILQLGDKRLKAQLLGSHSYGAGTWLWAWGNPAYGTDEYRAVTDAARWLRDESPDRERAWQLRTAEFPVDEALSEGGVAGWPLLYACFAWLRARATYTFSYGPGRAFLTIHDEQVPWPRPDPVALPRVAIDSASASGTPAAELLETYAAWHGLGFERTVDGLVIRYPGGSRHEVRLDERGRIADVRSTLVGADVPPPR